MKLITSSKNYHPQKSHHAHVLQRNGPNTQRPKNSWLFKLLQSKKKRKNFWTILWSKWHSNLIKNTQRHTNTRWLANQQIMVSWSTQVHSSKAKTVECQEIHSAHSLKIIGLLKRSHTRTWNYLELWTSWWPQHHLWSICLPNVFNLNIIKSSDWTSVYRKYTSEPNNSMRKKFRQNQKSFTYNTTGLVTSINQCHVGKVGKLS